MTERLPDFFIVGAPKAGSTSLYHYLDQHPEIYMSAIKEPNYFADEIRAENLAEELRAGADKDLLEQREFLRGDMKEKRFGGMISEWADYLKLFQNARDEKAVGEASVCYLWSKTAAANIRARIPGAKIVMVLRDPREIAVSLYVQSVAGGHIQGTFRETLEACRRNGSGKFSVVYPFLELGLLYEQVKRFVEAFPREQVLILFYEEYRERRGEVFERIFRFLGVDAQFRPDTSRRYHEFREGAAKAIDPRDREWLGEYYREDVRRLAGMLGRDLGAWVR